MRTQLLAALMVLAFASHCFADSLDETDAKRRGISIEAVQLEKAKAEIQYLEAKVAKLERENASLVAKVASTPNTASTKPSATMAADAGKPQQKPITLQQFLALVPANLLPYGQNPLRDQQINDWIKQNSVGRALTFPCFLVSLNIEKSQAGECIYVWGVTGKRDFFRGKAVVTKDTNVRLVISKNEPIQTELSKLSKDDPFTVNGEMSTYRPNEYGGPSATLKATEIIIGNKHIAVVDKSPTNW